MLPVMPPRRVTPLAGWSVIATFVLLGGALLSTVWSTRSAVIDASDTTRRGQGLATEQFVRAELAELEGPPTQMRAHDWTCGFRPVGGSARKIRWIIFPEGSWREPQGS
jgi:hypothetical protein